MFESRGKSFAAKSNGVRVLPLAHMPHDEPEKFVRRPEKKGVPEYCELLTQRQLKAAHAKFLWANGWPIKRICEKLEMKYLTVNRIVMGRTNCSIAPIEPPFWPIARHEDA